MRSKGTCFWRRPDPALRVGLAPGQFHDANGLASSDLSLQCFVIDNQDLSRQTPPPRGASKHIFQEEQAQFCVSRRVKKNSVLHNGSRSILQIRASGFHSHPSTQDACQTWKLLNLTICSMKRELGRAFVWGQEGQIGCPGRFQPIKCPISAKGKSRRDLV